MAGLVVGGVECMVEETQVTFGHLVVPLRDIVSFGVANGSSELVVAYERRADESGYREARGAIRTRATMLLALHGDHDLLMAWLRQRLPMQWRGYADTVDDVLNDRPREAPPAKKRNPIPFRLAVALLGVGVVLGVAAGLWLFN